MSDQKKAYQPSKLSVDFHVRGIRYWDAPLAMDQIKPGAKLDMVLESDNPTDSNAIALYLSGFKIGYVPRELNMGYATMLFYGHESAFEARVMAVDKKTSHPVISAGIYITDAR